MIGSCIYANGIFEVCSDEMKYKFCLITFCVTKLQPVSYFYQLSGPSIRFGSSTRHFESQPLKSKMLSKNVSKRMLPIRMTHLY